MIMSECMSMTVDRIWTTIDDCGWLWVM